ncbi:hypothetical protein E2C01_005159 [Portunus trituberculatus]|uniref:Uncharacterized protein n=1 Tax=Portunus trituberculatus TaxID=210409 RepID=A0A5B7CUE8_PORTR|nr:hypothetical protein [Portunus trituberculatus]
MQGAKTQCWVVHKPVEASRSHHTLYPPAPYSHTTYTINTNTRLTTNDEIQNMKLSHITDLSGAFLRASKSQASHFCSICL